MWKFFDQISCINLYSRDDRLEECQKVFKRLNIPCRVKRFHKHPNDGKKGCYESHLSVIRDAYVKGCENVLIFEDDVIESPYFDESLIEKAIEFMNNNNEWDIFYLGHQPDVFFSSSYAVSDYIMKTSSTLTHAYVMSRKFMKKMLNREYDDTAIDKVYLANENSYALYPMQFYQNESDSDITASAPIRGLRYSEFYAYHINYPILYFITLLISFIILIIVFIFLNKFS